MHPSFSVLVPVGPDEAELDRLLDLRESLEAHTHGWRVKVVLVDDSREPRDLGSAWPGAELVRTGLWRSRTPDVQSAHVAGTVEALKRAEGAFALKLDTDALVIAPFADKLVNVLREDPSIGLGGAFDHTPSGVPREWSTWQPLIRRSESRIRLPRRSRRVRARWVSREDRRYIRSVIRRALQNPGYALGAHCLGGAYVVSEALLAHAPTWRWQPWVGTGLGEDVVTGLFCAASGLRLVGMASDGEPFGVSWRGLPDAPERLKSRGYSIVHSVRFDDDGVEREVRRWFRENAR